MFNVGLAIFSMFVDVLFQYVDVGIIQAAKLQLHVYTPQCTYCPVVSCIYHQSSMGSFPYCLELPPLHFRYQCACEFWLSYCSCSSSLSCKTVRNLRVDFPLWDIGIVLNVRKFGHKMLVKQILGYKGSAGETNTQI